MRAALVGDSLYGDCVRGDNAALCCAAISCVCIFGIRETRRTEGHRRRIRPTKWFCVCLFEIFESVCSVLAIDIFVWNLVSIETSSDHASRICVCFWMFPADIIVRDLTFDL